MRLTDEMKEMVERLRLCYVATVTSDGKPNLSPKGSLKVWDDETVVFADIASLGTVRNLRSLKSIWLIRFFVAASVSRATRKCMRADQSSILLQKRYGAERVGNIRSMQW